MGRQRTGGVGDLGELRPVPGLERRLREAARLGFRTAVVPKSRRGGAPVVDGMAIVVASDIREAIGRALVGAPEPNPRDLRVSAVSEERGDALS